MHDEAGDGELRTDERGALNPQGAVEVGAGGGPELGEVGLGGETATVGADGLAHGAGDGFRLAAFDSGRFEIRQLLK